jgi:hypothetical protein
MLLYVIAVKFKNGEKRKKKKNRERWHIYLGTYGREH